MPRTPYQVRVYNHIRTEITEGRLKPGDRLPTEGQLAAMFGCSAHPVKLALRRLQREGVIEGHQGVGNFVAERRQRTTPRE